MKIKVPTRFLSKELSGRKNNLRISLPEVKKFVESLDYRFWICHGINFINSDYPERIWKPIFEIYEGKVPTLDYLFETITSMVKNGKINHTAAAWVVQPPIQLLKMEKMANNNPNLKEAYNETLWEYFHIFMMDLQR